MYRRKFVVTGLAITGALAGCVGGDDGDGDENGANGVEDQNDSDQNDSEDQNGEDQTGENGDQNGGDTGDLTGVETYSGEWSGSIGFESYSGVWQFEANFDEGTVEGWFDGDGSGDISGSVSGGEIDAQGGAAFGTVEWSGDFSADGQDISGSWEIAGDAPGSGTWSGSVGELENYDPNGGENGGENGGDGSLPEEDVASGEEPLARYPGSVMTSHSQFTTGEGTVTTIAYGTYDSVDEVENWYKQELGDPDGELSGDGEVTLTYQFAENEVAVIEIVEEENTGIFVEYMSGS